MNTRRGILTAAIVVACLGSPIATTTAEAAPIQLKDRPETREFETWASKNLTAGNEGRVTVDSLTFDPNNGNAALSMTVRHRHVVKVAGKKLVVFSLTNPVNLNFNVRRGVAGTVDLGKGIVIPIATIANHLGSLVR
jgi:hypothetical protein